MDGADFPFDFGAQSSGHGMEAVDANFVEFTFFHFVFNAFELTGQDVPALVALAEHLFGQSLGFGGAQVGNIELVLSAPLDKGGFGDVELSGDAIETPPLRTQKDEAGNGV